MLANHGYALSGVSWFEVLPPALSLDFFKDRNGLPNYQFP